MVTGPGLISVPDYTLAGYQGRRPGRVSGPASRRESGPASRRVSGPAPLRGHDGEPRAGGKANGSPLAAGGLPGPGLTGRPLLRESAGR